MITGYSPHQFLLSARLEKAARILISTSRSLETVAYECGFDNTYHFAKLFKKHYCSPPGRYRREHSGL